MRQLAFIFLTCATLAHGAQKYGSTIAPKGATLLVHKSSVAVVQLTSSITITASLPDDFALVLEASDDMQKWTPVATNHFQSVIFPVPETVPHKFFRSRTPNCYSLTLTNSL